MRSQNKKIILKILFHFYRNHKDKITALRLWLICRLLLDKDGRGNVKMDDLKRESNTTAKYIKNKCKNSEFFGHVDDRVYYSSSRKIINKHSLGVVKGLIRIEKMTAKFISILRSTSSFKAYITKCYLESDLRQKKPRRYTRGRISYETAARFLNIARRTVINQVKKMKVVKHANVINLGYIKEFKHKEDFDNWLLNNMGRRIMGEEISKNPKSYFAKKTVSGYVLAKNAPNIYRFSGVSLASERRGNVRQGLRTSTKAYRSPRKHRKEIKLH